MAPTKESEMAELPVVTKQEEKVEQFPVPDNLRWPILVKPKILMGSGPTNPTKRVTEALIKPVMGIYADETVQIMDDIRDGLKYLFQTKNAVTFCATGSGNAGMEVVLGNLIEPNDVVLICVSGTFGLRAVDMSKRYGADVRLLESKLGTTLTYEQIRAHVEVHKPKILFTCHGDSSTGVLQSLNHLGELCRRYNCLFVVDAVATLGAVDLYVDDWKIDAAFAASQKALGAPAGLTPITFGPRAFNAIKNRKVPSNVYYYDAIHLSDFFHCSSDRPRLYHHTICAQSMYAFRETIAEIIEHGFVLFKQRHADNAQRLYEGLQNIGLELFVENPEQRLPTITSIRIPHGVNIENVMKYMLDRYSLEISKGIGLTNGLLFRIGLMNANATHQKVDLVLRALYEALHATSNYIAPQTKVYY